jgi:hypothetical protein
MSYDGVMALVMIMAVNHEIIMIQIQDQLHTVTLSDFLFIYPLTISDPL